MSLKITIVEELKGLKLDINYYVCKYSGCQDTGIFLSWRQECSINIKSRLYHNNCVVHLRNSMTTELVDLKFLTSSSHTLILMKIG